MINLDVPGIVKKLAGMSRRMDLLKKALASKEMVSARTLIQQAFAVHKALDAEMPLQRGLLDISILPRPSARQ